MALRENLKQLREERHLSGKDLAKAIGVGYTTYMNYENQKKENSRWPNEETLMKIANVLNVSVDTLLGHDTNGIVFEKCVRFIENAKFAGKDIGVVLFADGEHVKITDKTSARYLDTTPKDNPNTNIGTPIAQFSTKQEFIKFVQQIEQRILKNSSYKELLSNKLDSARLERTLRESILRDGQLEIKEMNDLLVFVDNQTRKIHNRHDNNSDK